MNTTFNSTVQLLVSNGDVIITQIESNDGDMFVLTHSFTPSFATNLDKISYNKIQGIDITEFIKKNGANEFNFNNLYAKLQQAVLNSNPITIQLQEDIHYIKWSNV